jgi:hypothetical protein
MPRARLPLFGGEFLPEKRKRGKPSTMASQWRHLQAVIEVIRRMLILGEGRDLAIKNTAQQVSLSERDVAELYLANVSDAIYEVAREQILLKKISKADAVARIETILGGLEKNRDAQKKKRKR